MNIKLQTNEQLSATVANGLAGVFINGVSLSASLSGKADVSAIPINVSQLSNDSGYLTAHQSLSNYYTKSETSSAAEIENALNNVSVDLSEYYTKSETSSASEISTALENAGSKVYFDNHISNITGSNDLSVVKLSADEYAQMLEDGTCLSNAIYIVEAPNIDAFKQQIKNVAPGTDLSDAVNLAQLNAAVPTKVSQLTNDSGYTTNTGTITGITMNGASKGTSGVVNLGTVLTAHQSLTNYYKKSETSSATEISTALANAGSGSDQLSTKLDSSAAWPAWVDGGSYDYKQIVSHNGKLWKASEPFPSEEPSIGGIGTGWESIDINSILTSEYQLKGNYLTAVPTTYKTYSQTVAALSNDGYATQAQVNQKSTVSFNQITTTGTNIGSITIDGTTTQIFAPSEGGGSGSSVQVSADYSTGTRVATISVDSVPTSIYVPNSSGGSSRYALETAQLVSSGGSLTCAVDDQTITTIQVSSSTTPVVVQLPAQPEDGARDFILRIEISSSAAPTFTFNGVNETIDFDSEDDDWAVMEPGLNLVSFTETKREGGGGNNNMKTVTFDIVSQNEARGAHLSFVNPNDSIRYVEAGQPIGTLPSVIIGDPTNYVWEAWATSPEWSGEKIDSSFVITDDITIYAQCSFD